MRSGTHVLMAVTETRVVEATRTQLERAARCVNHDLPPGLMRIIVEPRNALADGRGEAPHPLSLMATFGEHQAKPRATVGPRANRSLCIRVLERGHDTWGKAVVGCAGQGNFQAKTHSHAQLQQLAQAPAMAEANAVFVDHRGAGPGRTGPRFFGEHPGQA